MQIKGYRFWWIGRFSKRFTYTKQVQTSLSAKILSNRFSNDLKHCYFVYLSLHNVHWFLHWIDYQILPVFTKRYHISPKSICVPVRLILFKVYIINMHQIKRSAKLPNIPISQRTIVMWLKISLKNMLFVLILVLVIIRNQKSVLFVMYFDQLSIAPIPRDWRNKIFTWNRTFSIWLLTCWIKIQLSPRHLSSIANVLKCAFVRHL